MPDESPDPIDVEAVAVAIGDLETQRKWLVTLHSITNISESEMHPSDNVCIAREDMLIAAYERMERICNSDRPYLRGSHADQD